MHRKFHLDVCRTSIQGVLDQLLHGCCKIDHHLPAGNSMNNVLWHLPDHCDSMLADLLRMSASACT